MGRRLAKLTGQVERAIWKRSPVVLMYHRVAPTEDDLWGICVEPDRFAEQIAALKRVRQVVTLDEILAWRSGARGADRPLAAVTFDDGYHDAFSTALPILERLDCAATVYVATGLVGTDKAFWWDELVRLVMAAPPASPPLQLLVGHAPLTWAVADDRGGRQRVCRQVRRRLRDLEPAHIDAQMDAICVWSGGRRGARAEDRAMSGEEVRKLSQSLVTIGGHTVRHPSLPSLSPAAQSAEIAESRRACEAWTGRPIEHFAYPFGHYDRASLRGVREAGFRSACATTPGVVRPWTDPLRLPRLTPGRLDGEALARLLG